MISRYCGPLASLVLAGTACLCPLTDLSARAQAPVEPDSVSVVKARDLLRRMTIEEKIGQMEQASGQQIVDPAGPQHVLDLDTLASSGAVGSFLFITDPARINHLQHLAVEKSRLHIPLLFGFDVIHGYRTVMPIPLAMASTWDPALVESSQGVAASEARAGGIAWAFAPMVDIARDPRWGRIMESAGEDPYLGEQMAAAQVRGLQGPALGTPNHLLATVKHFAAYGGAFGGRDYDGVDLSEDSLRNTYLRPYKAAVDAGVGTVMTAYMDLNSVPATGNEWLLQQVLRREWNFKGFVVSDWRSVESMTVHGFSRDPADAAVRAVKAGVNMEMTSTTYRDNLQRAIKQGTITVEQIDKLVLPILEAKYRIGLFDQPYVDEANIASQTGTPEIHAAAREAGHHAAVLLRNEGQLLPLSKSIKSIALIGPLADSGRDSMGGWSPAGIASQTVTLAAGLRTKLPNARVDVATGVEIERLQPSIFDDMSPSAKATMKTADERKRAFDHAIDLIKQADVAILALGEQQIMNSERASRATLTLPGQQEELLEAAVATGKPVVLLLQNGRPLEIPWAAEHVPAILEGWYMGTEAGNIFADLLVGDAVPDGKLPVTWPRSVGQEPLFYNTNNSQIPTQRDSFYWDVPSTPQYPFGFGLSYTTFEISQLNLASPSISATGSLKATVKVRNTGAYRGAEVVQLYTHQRSGSASRPVRELKAFSKLTLDPGESRTVELTMPAEKLKFWSPNRKLTVLEPGTFDLWVGDSSDASLHTTFNLESGRNADVK